VDHDSRPPADTSQSADESSDDEEEEKDDDKKDEGKDGKDSKDGQSDSKDKGKGVKGNTPQGKTKQSELSKKGKSLKRAGSPALSESSGNESTRKKLKKTATPATGSRAGSPLPPSLANKRKSKMGAGSGSDGEATAGEMSDGAGPKKKIKIVGSARGTPTASRAGSPNPAQGSKFHSTDTSAMDSMLTVWTKGASPMSSSAGPIEPWEILEKIPPEGITTAELIKPFAGRVGEKPGQMPKNDWIKLVKQLCDYGPDKRLRRRKQGA
jgi:transcription initiation factor TFIIF subunit alpha